jgi:hypothetical protein
MSKLAFVAVSAEADFDPVLAANTIVQREKRGGFSSF